jgi:hypothetical protein
MTIEELEARDDETWRAYCRIRDAASASMTGSTALAEFQRVHALITDPDPKGFEQFEQEVEAAGMPAVEPQLKQDQKDEKDDEAQEPEAAEEAEEWADEEAEDAEEDARASAKPKSKPKNKK